MNFKWEDHTPLDFSHDVLEEEKEIKVSCNADNPGCTKRGTKEIKLCWDIMNQMVYNNGVFYWNNTKYNLVECGTCNEYFITKEMYSNFKCEDCK